MADKKSSEITAEEANRILEDARAEAARILEDARKNAAAVPPSAPAGGGLKPTHKVKYRVEGAEWELLRAGDKLLCPKTGNVLIEDAKEAPADAFPDGTYKVTGTVE